MERREIIHKERNTSVSSNHVTHFTKKFDVLQKILINGFRPSFCNESPIYKEEYLELRAIGDFLQMKLPAIEDIEIPMVCFCDLPLKLSKYHRKIYGSYGISLYKSWAISNFITPVNYVVKDSLSHNSLYSIYNQTAKIIDKLKTEKDYILNYPGLNNLERNLLNMWRLIKPYKKNETNRKYYDEREWRHISENYTSKDNNNSETYLKFEISDIYQIVVVNSNERRIVNNLLVSQYGKEFKRQIRIIN